jgi:hypothetical protein
LAGLFVEERKEILKMGLLSWIFGTGKRPAQHRDQELLQSNFNSRAGPRLTERKLVADSTLIAGGQKAIVQWRADSFPMEIVGESKYQAALIAICGAHTRYGHDSEYSAQIEREPFNPFDQNAVVAKIAGRTVGYLSREQAVRVSEQMLADGITAASCMARVRGGWRTNQYDEGHYGVWLSIPNRGWIDFGIGASRPTEGGAYPSRKVSTRPAAAQIGPLSGEWVALIGSSADGMIATELANKGAKIMASVGKSTTLLVVAEERPFAPGLIGSSQYRRAQELLEAGRLLRIVSLSEVRKMMAAE